MYHSRAHGGRGVVEIYVVLINVLSLGVRGLQSRTPGALWVAYFLSETPQRFFLSYINVAISSVLPVYTLVVCVSLSQGPSLCRPLICLCETDYYKTGDKYLISHDLLCTDMSISPKFMDSLKTLFKKCLATSI